MKLRITSPPNLDAARFDFAPAHRMVQTQQMKSNSLKALRALLTVAAAGLIAGCETTGESVPVRTSSEPAPLLAQVDPAPVVTLPAPAATNVTATAEVSTVSTNAPDDDSEPIEVVPPTLPANIKFTDAVKEIIKLGQSTVDENVLLQFVKNTTTKFDLDADEILYLNDIGIPSTVIAEMLKHDGQDPAMAKMEERPAPDAAALAGKTSEPSQAVAPPAQPQPVEVSTNYIPNTTSAPPAQQVVVVEQQPQTQVIYTTPQPPSVTYFYSSLSPYGSWYVVPEYGWVWQPTVAVIDSGWRPYGPGGRWVWSSAGWYWNSDYSWGWAPFHYGRWYLSSHRGWVWVPDLTWGPSWVTWRYNSDYCGWAPLPPAARFHHGVGFTYWGSSVGFSFNFGLGYDRFCFVPTRHFYHRRPWDYAVPRHHSRFAYDACRPFNRWEFRGRDHFVNHGPGRDHIERHGGTRLQEVAIRDTASPATGPLPTAPRERFERRGETGGTIYRPAPPKETTQVADRIRSRQEITSRRELPARQSGVAATTIKEPSRNMPGAVNRGTASGPVEPAPAAVTRREDSRREPSATRAGVSATESPVTRRIPGTPESAATTLAKPREIPGALRTTIEKPAEISGTASRSSGRISTQPSIAAPSRSIEAKPSPSPTPSRRDYPTRPQAGPIQTTPAPVIPGTREIAKPQSAMPMVQQPERQIQRTPPSRRDYSQIPGTRPATPAPSSPAPDIRSTIPSRRDFSAPPSVATPLPSPAITAPSRRDFGSPTSPRETARPSFETPKPSARVFEGPREPISRRDFATPAPPARSFTPAPAPAPATRSFTPPPSVSAAPPSRAFTPAPSGPPAGTIRSAPSGAAGEIRSAPPAAPAGRRESRKD